MANMAYTSMYVKIDSKQILKAFIKFMDKTYGEGFVYGYDKDNIPEFPYILDFGFDTKWGLPKALLKTIVEKFPTIAWNATSEEPGCSYRGIAHYSPGIDTLCEDQVIVFYEIGLDDKWYSLETFSTI
jgi:hypothetical protein